MDPNTEAPGFSYDVDLAISQYHAVYQLHGKICGRLNLHLIMNEHF